MVTSVWALTSTVVLRMRFCMAPSSSSPSSSRGGRSAPFAILRSGTLPASLTSVAGLLQREPVVEVGGEERDDGEGAVGHGLAGQDGGEELGDLGDFVQRGHGADPSLALWRTQHVSRCDREGHGSRRNFSIGGRAGVTFPVARRQHASARRHAMSETREHGETEPAATAPVQFTCTGCGADVAAPDRYFALGSLALVPHAHHVLMPLRCLTC